MKCTSRLTDYIRQAVYTHTDRPHTIRRWVMLCNQIESKCLHISRPLNSVVYTLSVSMSCLQEGDRRWMGDVAFWLRTKSLFHYRHRLAVTASEATLVTNIFVHNISGSSLGRTLSLCLCVTLLIRHYIYTCMCILDYHRSHNTSASWCLYIYELDQTYQINMNRVFSCIHQILGTNEEQ